MRKTIPIFLLAILLASPCLAATVQDKLKAVVRARSAATCVSAAGTILAESWQDRGNTNACWSTGDVLCDLTWTSVGTETVDVVSLPAGYPTGSCSYGLNIIVDANYFYVQRDHGSALNRSVSMDIEFSMYVHAVTQANFGAVYILQWDNDTTVATAGVALISLKNTNGIYQIQGYNGITGSTLTTISLDTWYVVKLHLDGTAANSYLQVVGGGSTTCDAVSECTFTRLDTADGQYLMLGALLGTGAGEALDITFGYVTVN